MEAIKDRCTARKKLNDLLAQEESYWHQRSRVSWLQESDCNTRFFHASASQRHQKNKILGLRDSSRHMVTDRVEMTNIVERYFKEIFHTSYPQHN